MILYVESAHEFVSSFQKMTTLEMKKGFKICCYASSIEPHPNLVCHTLSKVYSNISVKNVGCALAI